MKHLRSERGAHAPPGPDERVASILAGGRAAIARAITEIENGLPSSDALSAALAPHGGRAHVVGVTGAPGAGKSTLINALVREHAARGKRIAVVAVDPSSPFSGGAVLGDRIRMQGHATDPGVFIRSMATRGHLGGLAADADLALLVLSASGKDVILVETVGVGQDEVDIVGTADVSLVVLVPGLGDGVQALKAGIMEIADVFVVNKADRDGVERVVAEIESVASHGAPDAERPAIVNTVATRDEGVGALLEAVEGYRRRAAATGALAAKRRARLRRQLEDAVRRRVMAHVFQRVVPPAELEATVERLARREVDPFAAADGIVERMGLA